MIIDIPDTTLAAVALGVNGHIQQFCFEPGHGDYPLLVEVGMIVTPGGGRAMQFRARKGQLVAEAVLTYEDIFETSARLKKVLSAMEKVGAA